MSNVKVKLILDRWLLQHALPETAIEDATIWEDRAVSDLPFIFEKVIIVDRRKEYRQAALTKSISAFGTGRDSQMGQGKRPLVLADDR